MDEKYDENLNDKLDKNINEKLGEKHDDIAPYSSSSYYGLTYMMCNLMMM